MTLYEELGIEKGATDQQIKDAYRRRVKKCHPDVGGNSPEMAAEFGRVQRAYEILSDPEARAEYDANGDTNMDLPVPAAERFLIHVFMEGVDSGALDEPGIDIVRALKRQLRLEGARWQTNLTRTTGEIEALERLQRKIRYKGAGENLFAAALDARLSQPRKDQAFARAMIKMIEKAEGLLDFYEHERDMTLTIGELLDGLSTAQKQSPQRRRAARSAA
jgi:curved DNA-binding protein CbpA